MRIIYTCWPLFLILLLLGVAAATPSWRASTAGTLALIVDASDSNSKETMLEAVNTIERLARRTVTRCRVAVYLCGEETRLIGIGSFEEAGAGLREAIAGTSGAGSDLGDAIRVATGLVLVSGGGSILVVSDGVDLGGTAIIAAQAAAAAGVEINVLPLSVQPDPEVAIESLQVADQVRKGAMFQVSVMVRSTVDQTVEVAIDREGSDRISTLADLDAGALHSFRFLGTSGSNPETLLAHVTGQYDRARDNNSSRAKLSVAGTSRFAYVSYRGHSQTNRVDHYENLGSVHGLDRYDAILLHLTNTSIPSLQEQRTLVEYVRAGNGLAITCSSPDHAAALRGGPLEEILPVTLAPPERTGDDVALVVLIDRSGSMEQADSERTSLALALDAAHSMALLLSNKDRYGLIAFDVSAQVLRELGPVTERVEADAYPGLEPEGGTDWTPALEMALEWLEEDPAATRHVVIVSDGQLGPGISGAPSGAWPEGITLSTVAVGDRIDADRLRNMSVGHGGRYNRVTRLDDLPSALLREGARLKMPTLLRGPFGVSYAAPYSSLFPEITIPPGGEVLSVGVKPDAEIAMMSDEKAPILVFGQVGWGKVAVFSTDPASMLDSETGAGASARVLATTLDRISSRHEEGTARTRILRRRANVSLDLLSTDLSRGRPDASVLYPSGKEEVLPLAWSSPGRAHGSFIATEAGWYVVETGGVRSHFIVDPVPERCALPFDPDWAARMAAYGRGKVLSQTTGNPERLPAVRRCIFTRDLTPVILAIAAFLFLLDTIFRIWKKKSHRVMSLK